MINPSRLLSSLLLLCPLLSMAAAPAAKPAAPKPLAPIRVLLAPALETTLTSQLVGRITAVNVSLGQSFAKGKPLLRFDCAEQNARLRMSEAELASARENYEAKLRLQGLQQASEVEVSLAASNMAKARAQIGLSQAQLSPCTIHAPFAGRAVKVAVRPHQGVGQGQILLELVSKGPLKLRLNAPAKWVAWLKPGTPFEVQIDETGKPYRARVVAINGRIDAVSQTIELEGVIDQVSPELLPGMSGSARFAAPA